VWRPVNDTKPRCHVRGCEKPWDHRDECGPDISRRDMRIGDAILAGAIALLGLMAWWGAIMVWGSK